MTELGDIGAVTFDAAGTLFFPNPSVGTIYQEVIADYGLFLDQTDLESSFRTAFRTTVKDQAISSSENRERAYWKSIVAQVIGSITSQPSNFDAIFEALWNEFAKGSRWRLNCDAIEVFDFLENENIPFALLTNWDNRVCSVLSDHGLYNRFSGIFISSEIGFEKPESGIFDFAAKSLGFSPDQMLHVGDHYEQDIQGARSAGWKAVHLSPNGETESTDCFTLRRLLDLREFIKQK